MARSFICGLVALALLAGTASADTYIIPSDYSVVCLDLEKGTELWRATPHTLGEPKLYLSGGKLIAESTAVEGRLRYAIDVDTGGIEEATEKELKTDLLVDVSPVARMGSLKDSSGRTFKFSPGNTRHLEVEASPAPKLIKKLDTFPRYLTIVGNLAIFTFYGGNGGGGEVYAYDVKRDRLAWEFDASKTIPNLSERAFTYVTGDKEQVYVSVDQVLFALDTRTGKLKWTRKLPRQTLRRYDATWTHIARLGDKLLVSVYEDLFLLRERDGKLLWSFDSGPFGQPWPVVHDGKVFVTARSGPVEQASFSFTSQPPAKANSALKVVRNGSRYSITVMSRRSIPSKQKVWWSLEPPPSPRRRSKAARVELQIRNRDDSESIDLDLSRVLRKKSSTAYVKFTGYYGKATVIVDGEVATTTKF